jgi:hypothetical protein
MRLRSGASTTRGRTRSGQKSDGQKKNVGPKRSRQNSTIRPNPSEDCGTLVVKRDIMMFPFITFPPKVEGVHTEQYTEGSCATYNFRVFTGNIFSFPVGGGCVWLHLQYKNMHSMLCLDKGCSLEQVMDCFIKTCAAFNIQLADVKSVCSIRGVVLHSETSALCLQTMFRGRGSTPWNSISLFMQ